MRPLAAALAWASVAAVDATPAHDAVCAELAATERAFCAEVAAHGAPAAFLAYMAPEVFLPASLELGRTEHAARAQAHGGVVAKPDPNVQLTWSPLRVDVSEDGTLGYTWGRYDYAAKGKDGKVSTDLGIYLTIWRRQPDGTWKFVFDGSPQLPADPAALRAFLARPDLPHPPE